MAYRRLETGFGDGFWFGAHAMLKRILNLLGNSAARRLLGVDRGADAATYESLRNKWVTVPHAPFGMLRAEAKALLQHLKPDGRWIQVAYPKGRWVREGRLPFARWGEETDGPGTPWAEWYDLPKLHALLEPARFRTILHREFFHGDFNWFDLQRVVAP